MIRLSRIVLACLLLGIAAPASAQDAAPATEAAVPAEDDFIRFVKAQQEPSKAEADAVDPAGVALIDMDGERAYYSGRDLIALMKQAREKTSAFAMSGFTVKGRIETDHVVTVTYVYGYEATTEGITIRADVESCETYEKRDGRWRLISGAYWHKARKGAPTPAPEPAEPAPAPAPVE